MNGKWMVRLLVAFGAVVAVFDGWQVVSQRVDLNQHLPGLYPVVLFAFAGMVRYVDRLPEPRRRQLLEELERDSAAAHTTRGKEGAIE